MGWGGRGLCRLRVLRSAAHHGAGASDGADPADEMDVSIALFLGERLLAKLAPFIETLWNFRSQMGEAGALHREAQAPKSRALRDGRR